MDHPPVSIMKGKNLARVEPAHAPDRPCQRVRFEDESKSCSFDVADDVELAKGTMQQSTLKFNEPESIGLRKFNEVPMKSEAVSRKRYGRRSFLNDVVVQQTSSDACCAASIALSASRARARISTRHIDVEGVSDWEAFCMIINVYVGYGIVAIPRSISAGGWLSLILIPIMAFLSWLTGLQITKSFVVTGANTYEDLGRLAAGPIGEWLVIVLLVLMVLISVIYVGVLAQGVMNNLAKSQGWSNWREYYAPIVYTSVLILLMVTQTLKPRLGPFSSKLGTYAVVVIFFSLSGIAASNIPTLNPCDPRMPLATSSFSSTIAGMMLNFSGHSYLPTVWREMADPETHFKRVSGAAFTSMAVIYVVVGAIGYAALGPAALNDKDGNAIMSLQEAMDNSKAENLTLKVIAGLLVVKILVFAPAFFRVALDMILPKILPAHLLLPPLVSASDTTRSQMCINQSIIALGLIGLSAAGYGLRPYIDLVLGFASPFLFMPETYLFPGVFFLLIARGQKNGTWSKDAVAPLITSPIKALGWTVLLVFFFGMAVYGLYEVIVALDESDVPSTTAGACIP